MKKAISIFFVLAALMTLLAGCGSKQSKIVGTWSYQQTTILNVVTERTYTFREDGTGSAPVLDGLTNVDMTYTLDGDQLTITRGELLDSLVGPEVYTVSFGSGSMTLKAEDGTVIELTKAE